MYTTDRNTLIPTERSVATPTTPEYSPVVDEAHRKYNVHYEATDTEISHGQHLRIKIYDLASSDYVLIEPIDVILEYLTDETLAIIPELELYGEGATDSEALVDLKDELITLFEDLNAIPEKKLGKLPRVWKRIVNRMIKRV